MLIFDKNNYTDEGPDASSFGSIIEMDQALNSIRT